MDLMNPICCLRKSIGIKCDNNNYNNVGIYANFDFLNVWVNLDFQLLKIHILPIHKVFSGDRT